jgi:hypothetical protein
VPYPLSLRGTVFSELADIDATLERVEQALRAQRAKTVERDPGASNTVLFRGSFLNRRFGGSVLTTISSGAVRASRVESLIQVEYELRFAQNILVRGAICALAFGFIFLGVRDANTLKTVVVGLGFWLLVSSLDYGLAAWMFPRFLGARLRKEPG